MARRPTSDSQGSLDSLLDTMTNVVGILVVVLIITQLKVSQAVRRVQSNLPEISIEEYMRLKDIFEEQRRELERLRAEWERLSAELEKKRQELEHLKEELGKRADPELARQAALLEAEIKKLREQIQKLEALIRELEARLAELERKRELAESKIQRVPKAREEPPLVARLPDPREAPEGARVLEVVCRYNKAYIIDHSTIRDAIRRRIVDTPAKDGMLFKDPKTRQPLEDTQPVFEPDKVLRYLERAKLDGPDYDVTIKAHPDPNNPNLHFVVEPDSFRGMPPYVVALESSEFGRRLRQAQGENRWLRYYVYPDSFEVYVAARTTSEAMGLPAGWILVTDPPLQNAGIKLYRGEKYYKPSAPPPKDAKPAPKPIVID